jgi:glutamate synthase (ferredoxin)
MVGLGKIEDPAEGQLVKALVEKHVALTDSRLARKLLERWGETLTKLVRVMPNDYKRVIEAQARMREQGMTPEQAEMAAFEANARDEARVGGN